jgi:hypothetical protein
MQRALVMLSFSRSCQKVRIRRQLSVTRTVLEDWKGTECGRPILLDELNAVEYQVLNEKMRNDSFANNNNLIAE